MSQKNSPAVNGAEARTTTNNTLTPDLEQAARFLTMLDETAEQFTFQTFADTPTAKAEPMRHAAIRHGSLEELADWLTRKNADGAGVFVTVQQTDLKGRRKENIERIRAVFQEDDGDGKPLPLEPHIVVESSPGKHHRYLLTEDAPLDEFEPVQARMVTDYGSDRDAKDRCRVLRVPGFYHRKNPDKPHMVRIVQESGERPHPWHEIKAAIPPVERPPSKPAPAPSGVEHKDLARLLKRIPNDAADYDRWLEVGMALHHETEGSDDGLNLWLEWSAGYPKHDPDACYAKWQTFGSRDDAVTIGTLRHIAKENLLPALMADADALTRDSDPDEISALVLEAATLPALSQRRVLDTIKRNTGIPLGTLRQAISEGAQSEQADHLTLARQVVDSVGPANVLAADGFVWRWNDAGVWQKSEQRTVRGWVQRHVSDAGEDVTKALVDSVSDLFTTEVYRPQHEWNVGNPESVNTPAGEVVLDDGQWRLQPHRRDDYRTTQIPVNYDPEAQAPRFHRFLREIFPEPDGLEKAQAILEMIGYTLMAHARHERFIILVGSGANGKSVLLSVLEALCGWVNVSGVQPSQFANKFQRAHLHLKLANIVTEVEQGAVIDDAALKGITSGEPTTVEHKFKDPFQMRPFSTCWFGTNHMPHTRDFSDALFRRALVIQFNAVFKPELNNHDPNLGEKLKAELPGILNLALAHYAKALRDGFTMPDSSQQAREEWRLEADQVAQFVEAECDRVDDGSIVASTLYHRYKDWAQDNGINRTLSMKGFRDRLTRLGFGSTRTMHGRFVTGIRFKEL